MRKEHAFMCQIWKQHEESLEKQQKENWWTIRQRQLKFFAKSRMDTLTAIFAKDIWRLGDAFFFGTFVEEIDIEHLQNYQCISGSN